MDKSIKTVFQELYDCEFPDTSVSCLIHQDLKRKLNELDISELERQRFFTKINLHECELYSVNQALTFGLPIASFVFGLITTLISLKTVQSIFALVIWLSLTAIAIIFIIGISQHFVNNRKKQAMYYKDKLEIIDALLKEKK